MNIQFYQRSVFNLAISLINDNIKSQVNIDQRDMIVSIVDDFMARNLLAKWDMAQIWKNPSFKGLTDFEIIP